MCELRFIRDVQLFPQENRILLQKIHYIPSNLLFCGYEVANYGVTYSEIMMKL